MAEIQPKIAKIVSHCNSVRLAGKKQEKKTFSGWPAKPYINANLSPAWISLAWGELGNKNLGQRKVR